MNLILNELSLKLINNNPIFSEKKLNLKGKNLIFNNFFSSIIYNIFNLNLYKTKFKNILSTPIINEECYEIQNNFSEKLNLGAFSCYIIYNSFFINCSNDYSDVLGGGAIRIHSQALILIINYTLFQNCISNQRSTNEGGAIYFTGSVFSISHCIAINCYSYWYGQFLSARPNFQPTSFSYINCSQIFQCPSIQEDGSHYVLNLCQLILIINGNNISNNNPCGYGSGFAVIYPLEVIFHFTILFNNKGMNLLYFQKSAANSLLNNCLLINNTVELPSLILIRGTYTFYNFNFFNNFGPIASIDWDPPGNIIFRNCIFDKIIPEIAFVEFITCEFNDNYPNFTLTCII